MARARKIAEAKTADGKTVMQMFVPRAEGDALSVSLRLLTQQLIAHGHGESGGGFGGTFGYGVEFENDVFLMHPFCWCEREDCLWCGGSGCQGEDEPRQPHRDGCYQVHLQAFAREHGELLGVYSGREHWYVPYGSRHRKRYDAFKKRLCAELGLDFKHGNEVHCSCGVNAEWKQRYDACQCDWHSGRGVFRFGPAASAPHFWHKASGLQVSWYKYIGRDNEVSGADGKLLRDIVEDCLRSIGCDSLETAAKEYEVAQREAEERSLKAIDFMFSDEGRKMMEELEASGAIQTFTFGGDKPEPPQ